MHALVRPIIVVGVLALVAWFGWRWMFPNDEAQIRAVLDRIATAVSASAAEGEVGRLARAASLGRELDPDVVVDAGPPFQRLKGREAIIGTAARLNASIRKLDVRFSDVSVVVDPDRSAAHVTLTAEARFDKGSSGRGFDARELDVTLRRLEGAWVVSAISLVRPLQPVDGR